jgi:crotonobetainyl-CoA:carnitine CoA-transferase CaiB-like acyl-CoA transferase
MLNYMATMYFLSGTDPVPIGNAHFHHVPYNTYKTTDGFIVIAVITDNFWHNLKGLVQIKTFDNPKYDTQPGRWEDRDMINAKLNEIIGSQDNDYWLERLQQQKIPCAPVNRFSEALKDEQVLHRNMVIELKHPDGKSTRGPGNPVKLSRNNEESFSPAPKLGQDTDTVLGQLLSYDPDQISMLKQQGVIG